MCRANTRMRHRDRAVGQVVRMPPRMVPRPMPTGYGRVWHKWFLSVKGSIGIHYSQNRGHFALRLLEHTIDDWRVREPQISDQLRPCAAGRFSTLQTPLQQARSCDCSSTQ